MNTVENQKKIDLLILLDCEVANLAVFTTRVHSNVSPEPKKQ